MRKNIKREIIQAEKKQFNERGYNEVSTQDIADAMGISKGNLNCHFKREEDIIEAVVEEMHSPLYKARHPRPAGGTQRAFLRVGKIAKENTFYFWHDTQLSQTSEKIRNIQNTVIQNQYALFSEAFQELNAGGSMQDEEYPGQYGQLVQAMMLTCTYWVPHGRFLERVGAKGTFLDCVWGILYPVLTDQGKLQYRALRDVSAQDI